jgi:SAM-dependent methyltransferase
MSAFNLYSEYYDLLYRDKDYRGEVDYVLSLSQKFNPAAKTLLDLGCGTGKHASLFHAAGYEVQGVDMSATMLARARAHHPDIRFHQGDARSVRLGQGFDIVTSLFHVASYQTTNADLDAYLTTAKAHLKPGGIFLFDFWYGPGVLSDPPAVRVKRLEDDKIKVLRIAEPTLHADRNMVDVRYQVLAQRRGSAVTQEIEENHTMRYFFAPELDYALRSNGLVPLALCDWKSDRAPAAKSWTACIVASHASE